MRKFWLALGALVFLVVSGYVAVAAYSGVPVRNGDLRADALSLIKGQIQLSEGQEVVWAPAFVSDVYGVGSVFPEGEYVERKTAACETVRTRDVGVNRRMELSGAYAFRPEAHFTPLLDEARRMPEVGASLEGVSSVEYAVAMELVSLVESRDAMLADMYGNPDCVAAIANVPFVVLFMTVEGREDYTLHRSLGGTIEVLFSDVLSGSTGGQIERRNAVRDERPRKLLWGFTRVTLRDDRLPAAAPDTFRLRTAQSLIVESPTEPRFVDGAILNTEITVPAPEEIERILSGAVARARARQ